VFKLLNTELYPAFCKKHNLTAQQFNEQVENSLGSLFNFQKKVLKSIEEINKGHKPTVMDYEVPALLKDKNNTRMIL